MPDETGSTWTAAPDTGTPVDPPAKAPPTYESLALAFIDAAIKEDAIGHLAERSCDSYSRFFTVLQDRLAPNSEWLSHQAHWILGMGAARYQKIWDRLVKKKIEADPRQGWLALPEYAHVPKALKVEEGFVDVDEASFEQGAESLEELQAQLKAYLTPRISAENEKLIRAKIRELKKVLRNAARQIAGAPEMKLGEAMTLHMATLETPATQQRRKAAKRATARRLGRT